MDACADSDRGTPRSPCMASSLAVGSYRSLNKTEPTTDHHRHLISVVVLPPPIKYLSILFTIAVILNSYACYNRCLPSTNNSYLFYLSMIIFLRNEHGTSFSRPSLCCCCYHVDILILGGGESKEVADFSGSGGDLTWITWDEKDQARQEVVNVRTGEEGVDDGAGVCLLLAPYAAPLPP